MGMTTKQELLDRIREKDWRIKQLEVALTDAIARNGELGTALAIADPDTYDRITPLQVPDSRFNRIGKLVDLCADWAECEGDSEERFQLLERIENQTFSILDYLSGYFDSRKKLSPEHIAKMQAGRRRNRV